MLHHPDAISRLAHTRHAIMLHEAINEREAQAATAWACWRQSARPRLAIALRGVAVRLLAAAYRLDAPHGVASHRPSIPTGASTHDPGAIELTG
jgi:hypothetical protein